MYDTILYPTDGDDSTGESLDYVRDLAERYDATVHVLHVIEGSHRALGIGESPNREASTGMSGNPSGADTPMVGDPNASRKGRAKAAAYGRELVREVARQLHGIETTSAVRGGESAEIVPDYADEHDIDVVVMGTRDRSVLDRYLEVSLAESVLRTADVPVLVVPPASIDTDWHK